MIYCSCIYIITLIITKYEIQQNTVLFGKASSVESNQKRIVIMFYHWSNQILHVLQDWLSDGKTKVQEI